MIQKKLSYPEEMPCHYDTQRDLIDRLGETIVRYKGHPYVFYYETPKTCTLMDVLGVKDYKTKIPLTDIDISSIELGYMNYKHKNDDINQVVYLERNVHKQYRQGLTQGSIVSHPSDFKVNYAFYRFQGFIDLVNDEYPTIDEALETLWKSGKTGTQAVAVSRDLCLSKEYSGIILLYFKMRNVGWLQPNSKNVQVMEGKFAWVIERYLLRYGIEIGGQNGHSS